MNKTLNNVIMFAAGAIIGSVATWKLIKTKYEMMADQEIESMKMYLEQKYADKSFTNGLKDENEDSNDEITAKVLDDTEKVIEEYRDYASKYTGNRLIKPETKLEEEEEDITVPYIITPEQFSDGEYPTETLTYYVDGVVEDDYHYVWSEEEITKSLGSDFADHFGEYEEDSVYVRNDDAEIDYEILRDTRRYSELTGNQRG